jgi:hypothetical protein
MTEFYFIPNYLRLRPEKKTKLSKKKKEMNNKPTFSSYLGPFFTRRGWDKKPPAKAPRFVRETHVWLQFLLRLYINRASSV